LSLFVCEADLLAVTLLVAEEALNTAFLATSFALSFPVVFARATPRAGALFG
jgi:hypothetical protein